MQKRKNIRLTGYDYSQNGAYFITVCIKDRLNLLWDGMELVVLDERNAGEQCSPLHKTNDDSIAIENNLYPVTMSDCVAGANIVPPAAS